MKGYFLVFTVVLLFAAVAFADPVSEQDIQDEGNLESVGRAIKCRIHACNKGCRKLNYQRGVCVGDRCQCR
ncbi:hypothetical protein O3G_MSEX012365 [Manduca sexta]|uniref:Defensin n=1 Tax=Manduca sexta TaxID=7130 RepID=A0A922CWI8_MANSE|nr:hypothetical protein O3G_MSEX012365 [Manduca sexta]